MVESTCIMEKYSLLTFLPGMLSVDENGVHVNTSLKKRKTESKYLNGKRVQPVEGDFKEDSMFGEDELDQETETKYPIHVAVEEGNLSALEAWLDGKWGERMCVELGFNFILAGK